jgi:hypothetical protein
MEVSWLTNKQNVKSLSVCGYRVREPGWCQSGHFCYSDVRMLMATECVLKGSALRLG